MSEDNLKIAVAEGNLGARKKIEEALRISEEEYRIVVEQHTEKIISRYDIKKRLLVRSKGAASLLQIPEAMENAPYSLVERGYVAKESEADYIAFYESMLAGKAQGNCVIKLHNDHWYRADYTLVCSEDGTARRAIISYEDITEQRERLFAWEKWQRHNGALLAQAIAYYECNLQKDLFDRIDGPLSRYLPESARESFSGVVRYAAKHFVYPADRRQYLQLFSREALMSKYYLGEREIKSEYRRVTPDGKMFWAATTIQLLPDPYSEDIKGFVLIRDIDKEKRQKAELQKRTTTDVLTGVLNRAALIESIECVINSRNHARHAFVMLDIDRFKELNDTLGHLFGDQVLIETARVLTSVTRSADLVGRLGSDEFVVFLTDFPSEVALRQKVERIREILYRRFEYDVVSSGSLGIAMFPEYGANFMELYKNADQALYRAKKCGKNQAVFFSREFEVELPPLEWACAEPSIFVDRKTMRPIEERYLFLLEQTGVAVLEWNAAYEAPFTSLKAGRFSFAAHLGKDFQTGFLQEEDVHPKDWKQAQEMLLSLREGETEVALTLRLYQTNGSYIWCKMNVRCFCQKGNGFDRCVVVIEDVDLVVKERRSRQYTEAYDTLTGYANFERFRLDAAALLKKRGNRRYALWYGDLKNFKFINDIYGYKMGDRILRYWAKSIADSLREGEIFARRSADHFAVLRRFESVEAVEARFKESVRILENYEELTGKKFQLEMVAGIYLIEKDEDILAIEDMLDRANLAQCEEKAKAGSRFAFYTKELRARVIYEKEIEADMHRALRDGEFCMYLQPQVNIQQENRVLGAEALVRWKRPDGSMILPVDFIPLFEKNGFIVALDRFIFEEACRHLQWRKEQGKKMFKIAVNVSRISAFQNDFAESYIRIKEKYAIVEEFLELEFTETVVVENVRQLNGIMKNMRRRGFSFSLDDFGSGYSSLNMLKDIIVEVLKLDMMFFSAGLDPKRDEAIVASVISMAKALHMRIIAEGVETKEQLDRLHRLGCDIVQGYYFGKPVPAEEFETLYEKVLEANAISAIQIDECKITE